VIVIQSAEDVALHPQVPEEGVTVTESVPPAAVNELLVGEIE
jgi:hypothetical protein